MNKKQTETIKPIDLMEQAITFLKRISVTTWLVYLIGVCPWLTGLLYFWADMSKHPQAPDHASVYALGLAGLYVWLKTCQALFASQVTALITAQSKPAWTIKSTWRLCLRQSAWQPLSLIVLPVALLLTIPFPWLFAFFHNLTVLESPDTTTESLHKRASNLARLWPWQNIQIILMLTIVCLVVCLNIFIVLTTLPKLIKMLTGIESVFTRSSHALQNTTFLMICLSLTYAVISPLVHTTYALRNFYGQSIRNGMDLHLNIRACHVALALVLLTFLISPVYASDMDTGVTPEQLNTQLDKVLSQPEYQWRMPRAHSENKLQSWLSSFYDWLLNLFENKQDHNEPLKTTPAESHKESFQWGPWIKNILIYGLCALGLALLVILGLRSGLFKRDKQEPLPIASAPTQPNLNEEHVTADALPVASWLQYVDDLVKQGQYRLALRACFLALLAHYADQGRITIQRFKTNLDYERDLSRYAHTFPNLIPRFKHLRLLFDATWYGHVLVQPDHVLEFREHVMQAMEDHA